MDLARCSNRALARVVPRLAVALMGLFDREWTLRRFEEHAPDPEAVDPIADQCGKILAGHHPGEQGCALAYLLARWIKGHHPELREEVLRAHLEAVRKLLDVV